MNDVRIGDLVTFVTMDYGIDIETPVGYPDPQDFSSTLKSAWARAVTKETQIEPRPDEVGVVVEIEDIKAQGTKTVQKWFKIFVREKCYWFHTHHVKLLF